MFVLVCCGRVSRLGKDCTRVFGENLGKFLQGGITMKKTRVFITLVATITLILTFSAWGAGTGSNFTDAAKVRVGINFGWEPFFYVDEDGKIAGYDYEVLKAVDELLPQYAFEFENYEQTNLFLALDSNKIDIVAGQMSKNAAREANYLFGEEFYNTANIYIIVIKERDDIKSLDDLRGKKVITNPGSNDAYIVEQYNKTHQDEPILEDLSSGGLSWDEFVIGFKNDKWDAHLSTEHLAGTLNKLYGEEIFKNAGEPVYISGAYYIFKKGNTELQQAVDGALRQLKESGKLSELSIAILGADYSH
jgi:L-cystine transport system substrate-binding protein